MILQVGVFIYISEILMAETVLYESTMIKQLVEVYQFEAGKQS